MKKKLLTLVLALTMVLSMSTTAMAAEETGKFYKEYNTNAQGVYPTEKLSFKVDGNDDNKPVVSVEDITLTGSAEEKEITYKVTTDANTPQGVYEYTITEKTGTTAGVTYGTEPIKILVMVDNTGKINTGVELPEGGEKQDTITNTYNVKDFTVAKDVTGNMSVETDEFEIIVTLTSDKVVGANITAAGKTVAPNDWKLSEGKYTYTETLKISESKGAVTFANIPYGVSVNVEETKSDENMKGYTETTSDNTSITINEGLSDDDAAVVITNNKANDISTGIIVNNLPYILVLAGVAVAAVVLFRRKRYSSM